MLNVNEYVSPTLGSAWSNTDPAFAAFGAPDVTVCATLSRWVHVTVAPGCTVILATPCRNEWHRQHHVSYPEVWERVLPETKDPYEIRHRFEHEFAEREEYIDAYRHNFGFHGVHGIMATFPLKRLKHAARVFVAGAEDPSVPQHVGFASFATVEDAVGEAQSIHGADATFACVSYPAARSRQ